MLWSKNSPTCGKKLFDYWKGVFSDNVGHAEIQTFF